MKVGVLQFFSWPDRRVPLEQVYHRAFDRIEVMDKTGYDAVWLAEHHFSSYSICPSVHMMGTHIAARTKHLRIGTAVSLAAFYHPLRLAEEIALLDVLSEGRVNWGAGRGFDRTEFAAFDIAKEDSYPRFREHVEIVLQAWQNERLTYHGQFHTFEDVEVLPKPVQQPHPPVWMAATSIGAITWAAEQGFSILMDPHSSHREIARKKEVYRATLRENGHSFEGRDLPVARLLAVADSADEAHKIATRGAQWMFGSYLSPELGHVHSSPGSGQSGKSEGRAPLPPRSVEEAVQSYLDSVILHGTPDSVAAQIEELEEEIPLDYLLCAPLSHGSFVAFTEQVLPRLL